MSRLHGKNNSNKENLQPPLNEQSTTANFAGASGSNKDVSTLHTKPIREIQQPRPIPPRDQGHVDSKIPRFVYPVYTLKHENLVCAAAISNPTRFIYTGGARTIKVWDLLSPFPSCPSAELECCDSLRKDYVICLKISQDGGTLVAGSTCLQMWDIAGNLPRIKGELSGHRHACMDLAISSDSRLCFACCPTGDIFVWDLHNETYIRRFRGHVGPCTCVRLSSDGTKLWTGGYDQTVKCWDVVKGQCLKQFKLADEVHSLDLCPDDKWLVVGLENRIMEVLHVSKPDRHRLLYHQGRVTKVRFATCGKWFISTGRDSFLYGSRIPSGPPSIFDQLGRREEYERRPTPMDGLLPPRLITVPVEEEPFIYYRGGCSMSYCDISVDGKIIVTCGTDATVFKLIYETKSNDILRK